MSSFNSDLLTNIFKPSPDVSNWLPSDGRPVLTATPKVQNLPIRRQHSLTRRTRIWHLHEKFHCSIVGTCLSTGELRRILTRLEWEKVDSASDHEIHNVAVFISRRPDELAKYMQKALDRRHQVAIHQFARAKDNAAIEQLWQRALKDGDIPGAYWALLTHPLATDELLEKAHGDVHMLSHLMGAANRADIRRLRQLEEENANLIAKVNRQQWRLSEGFRERDNTIRQLREALSRSPLRREDTTYERRCEDAAAWMGTIVSMKKALASESARRERLEQRLSNLSKTQEESEKARRNTESRCRELETELAVLETRTNLLLESDGSDTAGSLDLHGLTLLYAGGRQDQVPRFRALVDRVRGRFLHHDGGVDDKPTLLPGLISQSDIVFFPVDCISHGAAHLIKRLSRVSGKRYVPLRTSSLTCLLSALSAIPIQDLTGTTQRRIG